MGVNIEYYTKSSVSRDQVKAITAAAYQPDDQPWLLCQPLHFLDMPGFENQLYGASKLNLIPDPGEKAEAESNYDADKNDLEFLIDKLAGLSERFGVDWTIQIEGSPVGSIENGVCDAAVRDTIDSMVDAAEELGNLGDLDDFMFE